MTLNVKGEGLGAQVTGIDPENLDSVTRDEIREIVYQNKLVILKDVHPTPAEFLQLGRIIGDVVTYYEPIYHHEEHPEIFVSSTEEGRGVPRTGAFWHIDYMFMPEPFAFSMVVPLAVPGSDRGTYFIDLNKVWESLPDAMRDPVRGTFATHDPRRHIKIRPHDVYKPIGEVWDEISKTTPPITWPTVIRHPKTGQEILYICASGTTKIEDEHGRALEPTVLQELMSATGQLDPDFSSPFIHTQHYEVGDVVLWDNRVLMHRAKHGTTPGTLTTHRLTMLDGLTTPGYGV
ncbi:MULTISPECIES: (3R)-3-[(carboxymethyl)amino]fatty acid oxygenase/decarboxylase [Mycolicibacterium]|uniref:Oxidoreductase n=2 Tax=Mycolicibacterium fortuitum TaxID=1766 RepID=A0A378USZ2_MYCFO|nr:MULTISPECIES: TauD/TfdA family dioxygenase [Mycolicibacterium]AIY47472.1 Oxidoreductase [Mycobacterium sp. VKM Ac-1817D]CRL79112.1 oxidoreductase [Mycolicibacter nonchromogenicus]AMD55321.1 taurine catabolism dioxygenase [Mycolicibacterium fortuitum subsp. fortuitum DSM 46621 = ATCC 6841 = JCM 6387]EJZ15903.1 putative oxidoreductase [Mycolicibacterium fortuitum subsp. fortuitum DSM 46621 = ATCC 6841 = JCM 6387]MBP3085102.1 TauD/TfdA family dioxygenase [Mycolicibacterium fortuitum]